MYKIEKIIPETAPSEIIEKILDFQEKAHKAYDPEEIISPREDRKKILTTPSDFHKKIRYYAFHNNEIIGEGRLAYEQLKKDSNKEYCQMYVLVLPEHSRKLVGTRLLICLLKEAEKLGKTKVISWVKEGKIKHYGKQWVKKLGYKEAQIEYKNILDLKNLDVSQIQSLIEQKIHLMEKYDFEFFKGKNFLEMLLKNKRLREMYAEYLTEVTNLIPRGDTGEKDVIVTEKDLEKAVMEEINLPREYIVIIVKDKDKIIACSEIYYLQNQTDVAYTGLTGVRRDYQGKGLATLLKALMVKTLHEQGFERLETENASNNEAMLHINFKIGFKTIFKWIKFEGKIENIKKLVISKHPSLFKEC